MQKENHISILIPDGESHLTIQVVICLSRTKQYQIHILSSQRTSEIRFSKYVSTFTYHAATERNTDWIDAINRKVSRHDIDVIMPVFEIGIRRIIADKELLTHPGRLVPLPPLSSFDIAIDKWLLFVHCKKNELPCPQSWLYEGADTNEVLPFPVVVKPTMGFGGGMGISLLKDQTESEIYFSGRLGGNTKYLIQEYIEGVDYSCSVLCEEGHIMAYTIQKSESEVESHFGPQMVYRFEHNQRIRALAERLMKSLNWSGIASIDLRLDAKDGFYKILEVNTRFWRSLAGSMYAGVNFPVLLANFTKNGAIPKSKDYNHILFYDLKGAVEMLRRKPTTILNSRFWNENTLLRVLLSDPIPYVYKFTWRTRNIVRNKIKKAHN